MRKLLALLAMGFAILFAGPVAAADIPEIEIPDIEFEAGDSFYLRGSAAINLHWAYLVRHPEACGCVTEYTPDTGYGYSWGVGFGYETGTGLRFDGTIDTLETTGLAITKVAPEPNPGTYTLMLRSTLALANIYYDFSFGDMGGFGYGGGGAFGYVGAGAGVAWNHAEVNGPIPIPTGGNVSPAAAVMAGVGYDMGSWVADVGYRGVYINSVTNAPTADPELFYTVDHNWIHELRGTVRYRFN